MRLNSLHLCNFRQHVDTRIEFEPGITGIIGPNGSGKSTILEAIAWALYGMPAARGTRESIRSYRASPRAAVKVELDFELNGHRYLVTRGLTSAELYLDGATQPIATSISGVTELLRRRLGMSHEEFFNTYFTGQKELSVMAAMGPAERAQFLSRVLGYERLRTAQGLARDRRKAIIAEIAGLRAGMADADAVNQALVAAETRVAASERRAHDAAEQCEKCRRALDVVTPRWESVQRERDAMLAITTDLRVVDGERSALARDAERVARELSDTAAARRELERLTAELAPLPAMQLELQALDRSCNEAERRRTLVDTERSLTEEIARLDDRISKIETAPSLEPDVTQQLSQGRAELEQTQHEFEEAQGDWIRDKQEAETKRQALLDQLRDVQKQREQIVELGEGGTCPICARPLGTHFRSVLEVLDTQIETITVDGKYFRARIEQLEATPPEIKALDERRRLLFENVGKLERRLAKIQAAVQELASLRQDLAAKQERQVAVRRELETISVVYDAVRHGEVRAIVERLAPLSAQATKLTTQLEREPGLVAERERIRVTSEQVEARRADLVTKRDALQFSEASFTEMRERYERAAAELRAGELGAVAADAELAAARAALEAADRARAELARNEEHLGTLGRERRLHDELDRVFSDLRTDLNQALRPEISDLASRYIRELTDGRYTELELDDQYNVIVLEDAIPKPVISGGEEDLANLVLRLAISEMIAERAGQAFSLLILDEVFGSLDEARRHNVVDLLRRLQDRFEQVILITHIESVREGLDRVVTVRYDEETGSSRVETESRSAEALLDAHAGAAD
ncbi:MAG TPA: SMC family ATPase [Gemmatimonadaceae bacterium]|nr:SMC family ATPase [Gemmatimonadaceae bacterium]